MKHEKHCPFRYDDGDGTCLDCEAIRVAVAEERERCADVVEARASGWYGAPYKDDDERVFYQRLGNILRRAATAIREQQP